MKKLFFAAMMCVAAMSANAQVLTSETVKNVYENVSNQADGDFCFNAEQMGNDITTMFVYQKQSNRKGDVTLKPHLKYEYDYAANGTLNSRVTYRWNDMKRDYEYSARYDYTLDNDNYYAEYSRYNSLKGCFDQPVDKMVYTLSPIDNISHVVCYHRDRPSDSFQKISDTAVNDLVQLFAKK